MHGRHLTATIFVNVVVAMSPTQAAPAASPPEQAPDLDSSKPAAKPAHLHVGDRRKEAVRMHEWWCTPARAATTPCFQHEFLQQTEAVCGEGGERGETSECKKLRARHGEEMQEQRRALTADEIKQERYEMHDSWCELKENAAGDFCTGWTEHKAVEERKAEL
jgi:hypothetical protein